MFDSSNFTSEAYAGFLSEHEYDEGKAFTSLLEPVVTKFYEQSEQGPLEPELQEKFYRTVWEISSSEDFPGLTSQNDAEETEEFGEAELAECVIQVLEEMNSPSHRHDFAYLSKLIFQGICGSGENSETQEETVAPISKEILQLRYFIYLKKQNFDLTRLDQLNLKTTFRYGVRHPPGRINSRGG